MREEGRRFRYAGRTLVAWWKELFELPGRDRQPHCIGSESRERRERIAQRLCSRPVMRMAAVEMDEPAELVDVLDRVLQRRLPAGKQRDQEKNST